MSAQPDRHLNPAPEQSANYLTPKIRQPREPRRLSAFVLQRAARRPDGWRRGRR
jgi:hypothetical protein